MMIKWKFFKQKLFIFCVLLLSLTLYFPAEAEQATPTCEYGEFDVWMSLNNESWMNTTVTNISLQCGQPFFVKAKMKPSQDHIWLAMYLFEPGTSTVEQQSFTVLDGPCGMNEGCDLGEVMSEENKTVWWKLKVKDDPSWVGGFTPLSITGFFQKKVYESWDTKDISFSIARIYLNESTWIEPSQSSDSKKNSTDFNADQSFLIIPLSIIFVTVFVKFYKKNKK
jgi:hypothetical protein